MSKFIKCKKEIVFFGRKKSALVLEKIYEVKKEHRTDGYCIINEHGNEHWVYSPGHEFFDKHFDEVKDMFGKKDLKSGMMVETKNELRYIVIGNQLVRLGGFNMLSSYQKDMSNLKDSDYDVVKVFKSKSKFSVPVFFEGELDEAGWDLIWQRQEKTPAELELEEAQKSLEQAMERVKNAKAKIKEEK